MMFGETKWANILYEAIAMLVGLAVPFAALWLKLDVVNKYRDRLRSSPTHEKLLRPPGYSLQKQWDDKFYELLFGYVLACAIWMLVAFCYPVVMQATKLLFVHPLGLYTLVPFLACVAVGTWRIIRLTRLANEINNLRLGLRGEQAVGEKLVELAEAGFRAFHDLPAGKDWNVDHVVVGPPGVFVLETKTRSKPRDRRRPHRAAYRVTLDGDVLRFPDWDDYDSVRQTIANARWVADYLTRKTGERVRTEGILVLPGWYADKSSAPAAVKAMNPKYLVGYLRGQPAMLEPAQQRRIAAALEDLCRTVEF